MGFPRAAALGLALALLSPAPSAAADGGGVPSGLPEARIEQQQVPDPEGRARLVRTLRQGWTDLKAGRIEEAAKAFEEVLDRQETASGARIGLAIARMNLGEDAEAEALVLDGLDLHPESAALHEILGDLRNREERVREARDAWEEAFRLGPNDRIRDKLLKAERELHVGREYDFTRGALFNVRYDGEVDESLADEVLAALREAYWEIAEELSHVPGQPVTVLLYPKQDFRTVTQSGEWVGGLFDGKIRVPLGGLERLDDRARNVLVHELTHAIVHSKTRGRSPWWLHEGLAQMFEGKGLAAGSESDLLRKDPAFSLEEDADVPFEYASALSLTLFLEDERGLPGLSWLLELLGDGTPMDEAFVTVYGFDEKTLRSEWRRDLAARAEPPTPRDG